MFSWKESDREKVWVRDSTFTTNIVIHFAFVSNIKLHTHRFLLTLCIVKYEYYSQISAQLACNDESETVIIFARHFCYQFEDSFEKC